MLFLSADMQHLNDIFLVIHDGSKVIVDLLQVEIGSCCKQRGSNEGVFECLDNNVEDCGLPLWHIIME